MTPKDGKDKDNNYMHTHIYTNNIKHALKKFLICPGIKYQTDEEASHAISLYFFIIIFTFNI